MLPLQPLSVTTTNAAAIFARAMWPPLVRASRRKNGSKARRRQAREVAPGDRTHARGIAATGVNRTWTLDASLVEQPGASARPMQTIEPEVRMVRAMSFLTSYWCAAIFVCGYAGHTPHLIVWAIGLCSMLLLLFGLNAPVLRPRVRHTLTFLLGGVLTVLGLASWALRSPAWLPFCTLTGAIWFLGVAVAEMLWAPRDRGTMAPADADPHLVIPPDPHFVPDDVPART